MIALQECSPSDESVCVCECVRGREGKKEREGGKETQAGACTRAAKQSPQKDKHSLQGVRPVVHVNPERLVALVLPPQLKEHVAQREHLQGPQQLGA
jgi:hypothetical protein